MINKKSEKNKIYRIYRFLFCFIFIIAINILISGAAFAKKAPNYVKGDVLVVFKSEDGEKISAASLDGMSMGREALRIASLASENGAWVKDTYADLSEAGDGVFALLHSDILSTDELINELLSRPDVIAASPNYIFKTAVIPDDTITPYNSNYLWGLNAVGAPEVWSKDITGSNNIYVAVIDTGVDYNHGDLAANIDKNLSRNFVRGVSDFMDDNGHGTHVAGTIGAIGNNNYGLVGMNWNVKIIALKALRADGKGSASNIINALNYLKNMLKNNENINLAAINMSLEMYSQYKPSSVSTRNEPLWLAMKLLDLTNRVSLVVAAGNSGITVGSPAPDDGEDYEKGDYVYPASFTGLYNMVSVSALSADMTLGYFSNKNATIAAPGVRILSTWPTDLSSGTKLSDGAKVRFSDGTSMAAPHIAGAAALLRSYKPELTASQTRIILENSDRETMQGANNVNAIFNMADLIEYVDEAENMPVIAAARELPAEYQDPDLEAYAENNSNNNSDNRTSYGGGGGSSGCYSFNYGLLTLMMILVLIFNLKFKKLK